MHIPIMGLTIDIYTVLILCMSHCVHRVWTGEDWKHDSCYCKQRRFLVNTGNGADYSSWYGTTLAVNVLLTMAHGKLGLVLPLTVTQLLQIASVVKK